MPADGDYIVAGWRAGTDGRKRFAGTALFDGSGNAYAAARVTRFAFPAH